MKRKKVTVFVLALMLMIGAGGIIFAFREAAGSSLASGEDGLASNVIVNTYHFEETNTDVVVMEGAAGVSEEAIEAYAQSHPNTTVTLYEHVEAER